MALDVYTPQGSFDSTFPHFKLGNVYARPINPPNHSVSPETAFANYDFPYLVLGVAGKVTYDTGLGIMLDWS